MIRTWDTTDMKRKDACMHSTDINSAYNKINRLLKKSNMNHLMMSETYGFG